MKEIVTAIEKTKIEIQEKKKKAEELTTENNIDQASNALKRNRVNIIIFLDDPI